MITEKSIKVTEINRCADCIIVFLPAAVVEVVSARIHILWLLIIIVFIFHITSVIFNFTHRFHLYSFLKLLIYGKLFYFSVKVIRHQLNKLADTVATPTNCLLVQLADKSLY